MPTYREIKPIFPNPAKRFLFIHIPRTAGRFLQMNWMHNGFEPEPPIIPTEKGMEVNHFHVELYQKHYDIANIPHISIVRNPIDRFISCSIFLKRMYGDIQEVMEDPMMFSSLIENFPLDQGVNWFRPQMDFITSDTNLWKFEDGFGKDFEEWMSDLLDMKFEVRHDVPEIGLTTDEADRLDKSDRIIDNIKSLYRKDIEQLYPELATPLQEGGQTKT